MILDLPFVNISLGSNINAENIKVGSDVYLECHIKANPWVYEVIWLFEGRSISTDISNGVIISNQSLILQNVGRESRGIYQCLGQNEQGEILSNPLFLRVKCKCYLVLLSDHFLKHFQIKLF